MGPRLFRRRRSRLERVAEAIPQVALADVFADLAARSGVDLGEAAERVFGRLSDAVMRAETSAGALADPETARQLREVAARAAGRAAELAYRRGAERLVVQQRRSHRGLLLLSVAAGIAAGSALAYLLVSRSAQRRLPPGGTAATETAEPSAPGQALAVSGSRAVATVTSPFQGALTGLRRRVREATRAARDAQAESERRLWHEYRTGGTQTGGQP
jgi:hypothetical protein